MGFLDDLPHDWARPELVELRDVLARVYRRPAAALEIAAAAGIERGSFPFRENMRLTWAELLEMAGERRRLRELVAAAADDPVAAQVRPVLLDMLRDEPEVAVSAPDVDLRTAWKGDDQVPEVAARLRRERLMEARSRLVDIELAAKIVEAAKSVARLSLRFGIARFHATGFLVAPDLVLTNHHNVLHEEYGPLTAVVAEFDHDQRVRVARLECKADPAPVAQDPADDWAVLRLRRAVDRPPLALGSPYDIGVDDLVVIIQHPLGAFKQFALEPLAVRHVDDARIQYVADTQHGSSGAPVFDERMHVVALHHAEADVTVGGDLEPVWRNQGIRIERVVAGLQEHGIAVTVAD